MASEGLLGGAGRFTDLKRRLLFLLGALIVYRIGAHIPVPGIDPVRLAELFRSQRGGILDMFNMFSGGALSRFTIFALGIMPYISSSIIMQLMTVVSPKLEALKKEGEAGRRKITQYTRYGTLILATFQAFGIGIALEGQHGLVIDPGPFFRFTAVVTLLSNIVSNVPAVMLLKGLMPQFHNPHHAWLMLAMSSTLAGNLTITGSVANIIVVEKARAEAHIGFLEYMKIGVPVTVLTLAIGLGWLAMSS